MSVTAAVRAPPKPAPEGHGPLLTIDLRAEFGPLYYPSSKEIAIVDVPELQFAMVDGKGDPNTSPEFRAAVQALYGVSYATKFLLKRRGIADYHVGPLEALWWTGRNGTFSLDAKRSAWRWTAMILQPDVVAGSHLREAVRQLQDRKGDPELASVRFERFSEGNAVQTLHLGPYADEGPTIRRLHAFLAARGWRPSGKHHEIYLNDPRRVAPERVKTVLRQPFTA